MEDWHARLTLVNNLYENCACTCNSILGNMEVLLFKVLIITDGYLKGLINRMGVPLDPSDNMKSAKDITFFSYHCSCQDYFSQIDYGTVLANKVLERFLRVTIPGVDYKGTETDDSVCLLYEYFLV